MSIHMIFINIALYIAIGLNFVNLIDFAVRPHQRKVIKSFLEELTIRLDDIKLSNSPQNIVNPEYQMFFASMVFVHYFFIGLIVFILELTLIRHSMIFMLGEINFRNFLTLQVIAEFISAVTLLLSWRKFLPCLIATLIGSGEKRRIRRSLLILRVIYFSVFWSFPFFVAFIFRLFGGNSEDLFGEKLIYVYESYLIIWPIITIISVMINFAGDILRNEPEDARLSLKLTRAILWRIIEFEKGPIAALSLLLTFALGTLKILFG